jgi:hypothetical protein
VVCGEVELYVALTGAFWQGFQASVIWRQRTAWRASLLEWAEATILREESDEGEK